MLPITACQNFQNQFGSLLQLLERSQGEMATFLQTAQLQNKWTLPELTRDYQELVQQFQEEARKTIVQWFREFGDHNESKDYSNFIQFDRDQRVTVDYGLVLREGVSYFPSLIKKIKFLALGFDNIERMDFLEEVGELTSLRPVRELPLQSLRRLRKAGNLSFFNCRILTSLPSLEEVTAGFVLNEAFSFIDAPQLRTIGEDFHMSSTPIDNFRKAFPVLKSIGVNKFGGSVYCGTTVGNQILRLKEKGELSVAGQIYLS